MSVFAKAQAEAAERRKSLGAGQGGEGGVSREDIEISIIEAQWKMADAELEQDYALCSRLQRNMKELEVSSFV